MSRAAGTPALVAMKGVAMTVGVSARRAVHHRRLRGGRATA